MKKNISSHTTNIFFFFILLLSIGLRLYKLDLIPPTYHTDEAVLTLDALSLGNDTRNLLDTSFSTTIISNLPVKLSIEFFGNSATSIRMTSALIGVFTTILIYLYTKIKFNNKTALLAFFVASVSHTGIAYSRMNLPNIYAPFFFNANFI